MSRPTGGLELLVATGDQSFGSTVADAVESTGGTVGAEHVDTATDALTQSGRDDVDGAVVDDRIAEPTTVVERLTDERDLPVVVLTDPTEDGDTVARAIEAGATDVFPRTTTSVQYELVVERIASESRDPSPTTDGAVDGQPYREVFENASDGLVVHEPDTGEMLDVNDRFCEMTGYSRDELVGETVDLVTADDEEYTYERARELIRRARNEGEHLSEWREQHKDGHTYPVEVHLTLVELHGEERVLASVRDITERKRREREYEQIFDMAGDGIVIHDPESGAVVDANQQIADLLGYDREAFLDRPLSEFQATEKGAGGRQARELIRESAQRGGQEFEWPLETSDGETVWVRARHEIGEIGGEERIVALLHDITERRRRERAIQALQNATERLQTAQTPEDVAAIAVETASDALGLPMAICWFHDDETGRLEPAAATDPVREAGLVSELSADRYEYDVFLEGDVTEYTPREQSADNPLETSVLLPLARHGLVAAGTYEHTDADSTVLDVAKALADHVTTALDRVERDQAVRESERRFRLIAERIDEVIYLAEPDFSELLYVNPAYEEIYGQPVETLYSDATAFLEAIDERDREAFEADFEAMIAEIEAGNPAESYEFEFRLRQPSGAVRWVHATGYTVELSVEKRRFVGIVEDITERKHREQRLEVFNRILRHNLRNQLDVIRSHAEVLAEQEPDSHAERITAAVDELAAIGARARNTDRIISMDDTRSEVNLSETLREVVATMEGDWGDVAVTTELPRNAPLTTNEQAVQIAVESALENAIEHAESGVTVALEEWAEGYVVTVADDGPGIPEEALVPIETGTETHLRHGRGLGLWQLRWSVDALNGELSFDTTEGTTVRITVPDQRESEQTE